MSASPFISLSNLHKAFGQFVALQDINLDIFPGELVCFLGPSGCGKTTLLRIIAGLEVQTRGVGQSQSVERFGSTKGARTFEAGGIAWQ